MIGATVVDVMKALLLLGAVGALLLAVTMVVLTGVLAGLERAGRGAARGARAGRMPRRRDLGWDPPRRS